MCEKQRKHCDEGVLFVIDLNSGLLPRESLHYTSTQ